jgi:hypothetical protein
MLLRQCLQELRLQRGELDALVPAFRASGRALATGGTQTGATEIPAVTSHGLQDGRQVAVPRLDRASNPPRLELALAA